MITQAIDFAGVRTNATFLKVFVFKDDHGNILYLQDMTWHMQVKDGTTVILDLTSPTDIAVDATSGTITILVAETIMQTVIPGSYKYDVQMTDSAGVVEVPLSGKFRVVQGVTNDI